MSKFQPSHLLAVWPWGSHCAFLCLSFFNLQMRDDNSVYFMGLLWWLNGSIYVEHWAWHITHIFAIIAESWGHQTHLNSLNMKSPRLGRVNISVSISQRTPGFSGYSKTEQIGSTDPQQSWYGIRTRIPNHTRNATFGPSFHHLNGLDSQKLLPPGD